MITNSPVLPDLGPARVARSASQLRLRTFQQLYFADDELVLDVPETPGAEVDGDQGFRGGG